jgi:hypothetical protein
MRRRRSDSSRSSGSFSSRNNSISNLMCSMSVHYIRQKH